MERPSLYCICDIDGAVKAGIFWSSLSIVCLVKALESCDQLSKERLKHMFSPKMKYPLYNYITPHEYLFQNADYNSACFGVDTLFDFYTTGLACSHVFCINGPVVRVVGIKPTPGANVALTVIFGPDGDIDVGTMQFKRQRNLIEEKQNIFDIAIKLASINVTGILPFDVESFDQRQICIASHIAAVFEKDDTEKKMLLVILMSRRLILKRRIRHMPAELWEMMYNDYCMQE